MRLFSLVLIFLACAPSTSTPAGEAQESTYVFTNVNVVNVRTGDINLEMDVFVNGESIAAIVKAGSQEYGSAISIDGTGKYLVPGLAEMHAHIPQGENELTLETLFLYLSNGVTTIRGMLGHPSHLPLREKAVNNELLSPRIFTSSPSLNGNTVKTKEEARTKVTQYQADGYDFLKIHPGIQLEVFNELVATANEVGIPYAGHVPVFVGINRALESKYASVDHIDGYLEGLVPETANVDPESNGFFGYNFTDLVDESLLPDLIQKTAENQVWIVPTQSLFDRWFSPQDAEELANQPEMKYMPASTIETWVNSKKNLVGSDDYDAETWRRFNAIRLNLLKQLQEGGHGLLLGSDAPQVFNVPGFSIHHEMQGMLDAGLTPLQILQSGTLNPATYFGMEGEFGEIIPEASADLVLINGNPLDNLTALRNPAGVMVRGQWLDRALIDARLLEIAERRKDI